MSNDDERVEEPLESEKVDELAAWQAGIDTRSAFVGHMATDYPTWLERTFGRRVIFYPYTGQRFGVYLDGERIQWGRMNKRDGVSITLPLTKDGPAVEQLNRLRPQVGFHVSSQGSKLTLQTDADYAIFKEAMRLIGGLVPEHVEPDRRYDQATLDRMIARFRRHYPSFDDERFYDQERFYKDQIAERIRSLLGKEQLGALLAASDFDAAKAAIKQACTGSFRTPSGTRQQNNLINQWDLRAIDAAPAEVLARRLYDLLYGEGDFAARFAAWVDLLADQRPGVWPLATYFLAMLDPTAHIFVRPVPFQTLLREIGDSSPWPTKPTAGAYARLQQLGASLLADLRPLGARDLIDAQSFVWIIQAPAEARAWIFQSNRDNYDLPGALAELETIDWSVRQHADRIKVGDTVYMWESGPEAGILAVARVLSEPAVIPEDERELRFYREPERFSGAERRVRLQIEQVLEPRLLRRDLQADPALKDMAIFRNAQGTNFALTEAEATALAALIDAPVDDSPPEAIEILRSDERIDRLATWQADIDTLSPFNHDFVQRFPVWLAETYGTRVIFIPSTGQRFSVYIDGYRALWGRVNKRVGVMLTLADLYEGGTLDLLQAFSPPLDFFRNRYGVICTLYNDTDYAALQQAIQRVFAPTETRPGGQISGLTLPPDPLDGPAFVLIHKRYGPVYQFTREAGGSPLQLIHALEEWQQSGIPVYAILYRPSPYKAFASWGRVEHVDVSDDRRAWTVHFDLTPFEPPIPVHRLVGVLSWLDPDRNLAVAFRGISIRPIPSSDIHTILAVANTQGANGAGESAVTDEGALLTPVIFAPDGTAFWRFNVRHEHWDAAYLNGILGWEGVSTSQGALRLRRIKAGDRIVAYIPGGLIGGIGIVTRPYQVDDPQNDSPASLFGGGHLQRIGVLWAGSPTEPVNVLSDLKDDAYAHLFARFSDPNPIAELTREEYIDVLTLLGVDDIEPARRLPHSWATLADYVTFAQRLGDESLTIEQLAQQAQEAEQPPATQDVIALATELRQLRLLAADATGSVRTQPYIAGDSTTLRRLAVLALLLEDPQRAGTYTLPARLTLPRLRAAATPQPINKFAPELGVEGPTLLGWYAEAGLVTHDGDTWQATPDAFALPSGDDSATTTYRAFLSALLGEIDGQRPTDLHNVGLGDALIPAPDLQASLAELGRELIIDTAVIRRIYRSLMAGRHIVLGGPPGTGKTELARRLPSLLWREPPQVFQRVTTTPDSPPVAEVHEQRHGYAAVVVTATEDWGVRDVVGGIGPRLDSATGGLSYTIEHGALTRVVLQHFAHTENGKQLPPTGRPLERKDYIDEEKRRYRGVWLIIDEFTRAPIDAAFGSLLTTLSGGKDARLAVPTAAGDVHELPLPGDFRIIGTLNSFDRHFLNQISEAMKRRFDFIDVLPPRPADGTYEQGLAALQALDRLRRNGFTQLGDTGGWPGMLTITSVQDMQGLPRYTFGDRQPEAEAALSSFWRLFSAIRVFRQLGTAQVVAVYTNLFAGVLASEMSWPEALDTALADALADQLQVLSRDAQRTIDAFVEHAGSPAAFVKAVRAILSKLPAGRRAGYLHTLHVYALAQANATPIPVGEEVSLTDDQIIGVFELGSALSLPADSIFRSRLRDLIGERGL